jgi:hypothetical protein
MKRSIGVTLSAVVTIFGSVLMVLLAALLLVGYVVSRGDDPDMPPYPRVAALVIAGVMLAFAAWGITTAVGLLRLRRWARVCILVASAFMVITFGIGAVLMAFVPLPSSPGDPPGLKTGFRIGIVCFYGVLALIGGWWLYLFNRAPVVAQFAPGPPPSRPLSVLVIAWHLLFGSVACFVCTWLPFPATLFSFTITGWTAKAVYLLLGLSQLWLGAGLLQLRPLSRILTIGFSIFAALNCLSLVLLPGAAARLTKGVADLPASMHEWPLAIPLPLVPVGLTMALLCSVPIWFLVRNRSAFVKAPPAVQ